MIKKVLALIAVMALAVSMGACSKGDDKPIGAQQPGKAPGTAPGIVMPAGEPQTVVPAEVQATWGSVKLSVENKAAGNANDVVIKIGGTYTIPNSNLTIKVGEFLPDFKMDGLTITSFSNQLNNPAVKVTVTDGANEVFSGWLYSKFPAIHPFQHENYGLLLLEGVKKG